MIRDLLQVQAPEEVTKSIIHLEIEEGQVLQKKGDVVGDEREVKGYLLNKYNIFAI